MTSTGIAAPPDAQTCRLDVSASPASGWWSIAEYIVGTPSNTVTRSRAMISSALPGSKRGIRVSMPPARTQALSPHVCPKEWNSGSAPRTTASSDSENRPRAISTLRRRLSCVSSAPLGVPVVPDV